MINRFFTAGLVLSVLLLFALSACGTNRGVQQSAEPETETTAEAEEEPETAEPLTVTEPEVRLSPDVIDRIYLRFAEKANRKLTLFFRAQQRYGEGSYTEALDLVNRALELQVSADALALKGLIFYRLGAEDQAERHWAAAAEIDPDVVERIILPAGQ